MIKRRTRGTGIQTKLGNHTFRTGISGCLRRTRVRLKQRSTSPTTSRREPTKLYDRGQDEISLDEVERICDLGFATGMSQVGIEVDVPDQRRSQKLIPHT